MKKIQTFSLFLAAAAIVGCNGLGKMAKNASTVKYEVTPNPLELHGDSVSITVKGTYPAKYYAKKVALTITPVLKTPSGDKSFKPLTTGGESSKANGTIINSKAGGSFTYTDKIPYTPDMRAADVMIQIKGSQGSKTQDFPELKIADATITTPLLVQKGSGGVIVGKDQFVRITPVKFDGTMYYVVNSAKVNESFNVKNIGLSNKAQFALIDSILRTYNTAPYTMKGIDIMGNASPDGKLDINTPLAENRSKASAKYFQDKYKKNKMNADSALFHMSSTSEDWPGFEKLMNESDIPMKDVILRICASNSDPEAREMEIKKMTKAYTEVREKIMPKLRKSDVTFNAEKVGRSDDQISALAISNPDSLTAEEILYAGSLATDNDKKLTIYRSAERIYPQDWRAANNTGMILFKKGDYAGAKSQFEKANQLSANNPVVMNNLGASYLQTGDRKKAAEMFSAASGAGNEVSENLAILDILNGNYAAAVSHCGDVKSFNCALAKLLNGDKDGAMSTLDASPDKDSAIGLYLKAVISARKDDASGVVNNLKSSIAKDAAMKPMAKEDREFLKWYSDANFKGAVE